MMKQALAAIGQQQVAPGIHLDSINAMLSRGYHELSSHCSTVYSMKPYCLKPAKLLLDGGTDPLDYIHIYKNEGNPSLGIPRHWHYVGFGLSDIRGYSMVYRMHEQYREQNPGYAASTQPMIEFYPMPPSGDLLNGFGFELTFRVKCNSLDEWDNPPQWPGQVMQALARYVFQSRNMFSVGDHAAWNCPLDSNNRDDDTSRIEHILMTFDPQLGESKTWLGKVRFIQIVGVCDEELDAARQWNVRGILEMMKEFPETGGQFLVTDMRRGETIFELDTEKRERLKIAIKEMGSDMTQISAKHKTSARKPRWFIEAEEQEKREDKESRFNQYEPLVERRYDTTYNNDSSIEVGRGSLPAVRDESNISFPHDYPIRTPSRMSQGSESDLKIENAALYDVRYYDSAYILLSRESARVLPTMLNGRLAHKRHFSFQSFQGDSLITFQPEGNAIKSLVGPEQPFAKQGHWLQIYVSTEFCERMQNSIGEDFNECSTMDQMILPKNYSWPDYNLHMTIVEEITDDHETQY